MIELLKYIDNPIRFCLGLAIWVTCVRMFFKEQYLAGRQSDVRCWCCYAFIAGFYIILGSLK